METLKVFGQEYERKLINQIISNIKAKDQHVGFGETIIEDINVNHFNNLSCKEIISIIKKHHKEHDEILDKEHLTYHIQASNRISKRNKKTTIKELDDIVDSIKGIDYSVRDVYQDFMFQIYMEKAIEDLEIAKNKNDIQSLEKISNYINEVKNKRSKSKSVWIDLFEDSALIFTEKIRNAYSFNCGEWLDYNFGGGIAKGDLVYIMMRKGFGKTTLGSRIAAGFIQKKLKVAHIVWEDRPEQVKAKIFSALTDTPLNQLYKLDFKEINETLKEYKDVYRIRRAAKGTTVNGIKSMIDELCKKGFVPDLLVVDYIKKVKSVNQYTDSWGGGGEVMEDLEDMINPLNYNIACIALDQINRKGYNEEIVDGENTSGDIGKLETAHAVISFSGTNTQRNEKKASIFIAHSRFGEDRLLKEDIIFDNSRVYINTGDI